jgi:hypothetical protein
MGLDEIREDLGAQIGMAITFSGKTNKQLRQETGVQQPQLDRLRLATGVRLDTLMAVLAACGKRLEVVDLDHTAQVLSGATGKPDWFDAVVLADEFKIMDRAGKLHTFTLVKE